MCIYEPLQRVVKNAKASLSVDLYGGAFTDFRLKDQEVNPLCFKFSRENMPENNRAGAPYKGHFACIGRWGEPSEGEIKAGLPNHGHFANILWEEDLHGNERVLTMSATSQLEGLHVKRKIEMDANSPVVAVEEEVRNIHALGRLFNMVQHPTLAHPFLDNTTVVDCNASIGFNQAYSNDPHQYALRWPLGHCPQSGPIDLRTPRKAYNALYSFAVDKKSQHGWITAFSPGHNTVLGYIWKRSDYPWIHLWQHWDGDSIRYRGVEFGTAGFHKPFNEIIQHPLHLFDERTCAYIDADEIISKRFLSFTFQMKEGFTGIETVEVEDGEIKLELRGKRGAGQQTFHTQFTDFLAG